MSWGHIYVVHVKAQHLQKYKKIVAEMNKNNITRIKAGNTFTKSCTDNHEYMARK
jgi:hypothetical protein